MEADHGRLLVVGDWLSRPISSCAVEAAGVVFAAEELAGALGSVAGPSSASVVSGELELYPVVVAGLSGCPSASCPFLFHRAAQVLNGRQRVGLSPLRASHSRHLVESWHGLVAEVGDQGAGLLDMVHDGMKLARQFHARVSCLR